MKRRKKAVSATGAGAAGSHLPSVPPVPSAAPGGTRFAVLFAGLALFALYSLLSYLSRGPESWWFIDFVAEGNIYWGDDAYRFFLARSAWHNPDAWWFNFTLPVALLGDAIVTTISGNQLLLARFIKAALTVLAVGFVYLSCLRLGLRRHMAFLGAGLLALMPLYFFVSMSFFAEAWLGLLIPAALWAHLSGRKLLACTLVALLPLVRIEGIFFVATVGLVALQQRDWRSLTVLLAPGAFYGLLVMAGPGLMPWSGWRFEMMKVYAAAGDWYGGVFPRIFKVFFLPWLLMAIIGLWLSRAGPVAAYAAGTVLMVVFVVVSALLEAANFEPRYLSPVMPVLAVGGAVFLDRAEAAVRRSTGRAAAVFALLVLAGSSLVAQFFSLYVFDHLRTNAFQHGRLPEAVRKAPLALGTYFRRFDREQLDAYREYAAVVTRMLEKNPGIDTVVVSDFVVFYFLEPDRIPRHVRVVFALFGRGRLEPILGTGQTAGYFAHPPFFARFSYQAPWQDRGLMLYLDQIPMAAYPYHWNVRGRHIYLFAGQQMSPSLVAVP